LNIAKWSIYHDLAHISGKIDRIFMKILFLDKEVCTKFWKSSRSRPYSSWRRSALAECYCSQQWL